MILTVVGTYRKYVSAIKIAVGLCLRRIKEELLIRFIVIRTSFCIYNNDWRQIDQVIYVIDIRFNGYGLFVILVWLLLLCARVIVRLVLLMVNDGWVLIESSANLELILT